MTILANLFARFSVDRWNPFRGLRFLCRLGYQGLGNLHLCRESRTRGSHYALPQTSTLHGPIRDTYPWPYNDPRFANWPECDTPDLYTLISDPAGFVIRHSTSYCAWKLRELTGHWLKHRRGAIYHAKDWQQFLADHGYTYTVRTPAVQPYDHYIGIDPTAGEFGQLYWFERYSPACYLKSESRFVPEKIYCSTYIDHEFTVVTLEDHEAKKLIWVCVD